MPNFIRVIVAGAIFIVLNSAAVTSVQARGLNASMVKTAYAESMKPLTLKFDGIDLAAIRKSSTQTVERDMYSRVRMAAKSAGLDPKPAEIKRASQKIITLLRSDYVTEELAKSEKTSVTINVDLTFEPLTTQASFKF